jgi:ABC-type maltose transport system permease subunit
MIIGNLIIPDIKLGGRYLILLEALITTVVTQFFGYALSRLKIIRYRSFFAGFSILICFFLIHSFFSSVNLSLLGILILYLGAVLLEMILPDHL